MPLRIGGGRHSRFLLPEAKSSQRLNSSGGRGRRRLQIRILLRNTNPTAWFWESQRPVVIWGQLAFSVYQQNDR